MKKYFAISLILGLAIIISACGLTPSARPVSDNEMQTEIVMLLTSMVTETQAPIPSETPLPPPTREATMLPVVLVTATPEMASEVTNTPSDLDITPWEPTLELLTNTPGGPTSPESTGTVLEVTSTPASDVTANLGEPTFKDTFENGDNWYLGKDAFVDLRATNGSLVMQGLTATSGWRLAANRTAKNYYLEITGKMAACKETDGFGLMFRVPNLAVANSGYLFGISCDGKFSLRKWNGDKMVYLVSPKANEAINKGANENNTLLVMAKGSEIKLYINDVFVGSAADKDYLSGGYGVYVSAKETKDLTIIFDDLSLWGLP